MQHYVISRIHLIKKALSLKKFDNEKINAELTENQVKEYIDLVVNEILRLSMTTKAFTFQIIEEDNSPNYSNINSTIAEKIKKVKINHDKNKQIYSTSNTNEELIYSFTPFIPAFLKTCLEPVGYKKALNISTQNQNNKRFKKAFIQSNLSVKRKSLNQLAEQKDINSINELGEE